MPVEQLFYTDRPRGKGLEPAAAGYQIKACSAGLSPESRRQLNSICMHYGDVVHRYAPRAAQDQEMAWRAQAESLSEVPDEILNAFPEIWTYDRLGDDVFALTRIRYTGLTHDGRTGNFFAHALVFPPESLATHSFNPLALSRAGLFKSNDPTDETALHTYPDLGSPTADPADNGILRGAPYHAHLAAMVSALCPTTPSIRPVLICLADWRQATPLVEVLVNLLPPAVRCRTTFCTYESDPKWLVPTTTGERPTHLAAAHDLLVLCGPDDRSFNLRPEEYQSVYAVFNFVDHQFSDLGEPRRYAAFAAACVHEERTERLEHHHTLVAQLGFDHDPTAWDTLVPAADLLSAQLQPDALVAAAQSLATLATEPRQARIALERLLPHIEALAHTNNAAGLSALTTNLARLTDRVATAAEQAQATDFVSHLRTLATMAFVAGQGRTTAALLTACGKARDGILLALLNDILGDPVASRVNASLTSDWEQLVELFLDGLRLAEKTPDTAPPLARLLVATFRTAHATGLVPQVWEGVGGRLVKAHLGSQWDAEKRQLVRDLIACVPVDRCPDANAWLNLRLLEATPPQSVAELIDSLEKIAGTCSRCADAATLTQDALRIAREQLRAHPQRAEALGRLAEAAHGTASGTTLFAAYRHEMEQAEPNQYSKIRQALATAGVVHVLCRELLAEVLPWNEENGHRTLQSWQSAVLKAHAKVLDGVRQEVAILLGEPEQADSMFPLAEALIPKQPDKSAAGRGLVALYGAVARVLPLEPLSNKWRQALASLPGGVAPEAQARLRVLQFMGAVAKLASDEHWSPTDFPHSDPAWRDDIRSLGPGEKAQVLEWCLDTFATTGVTTAQEAEGLVVLLRAAGEQSADTVANAVAYLLKERDPVTAVLVATAFALCALEGAQKSAAWGVIVRAILEPWDKSTRRLFEAHLAHRFGRRGQQYNERLLELCDAAGLPRPILAALPTQAPSPWPSVAGMLDWAKWPWRKLRGGSKDAPVPPGSPQSRER
jgi:hypothetical protein